jgi:hypothetical protein
MQPLVHGILSSNCQVSKGRIAEIVLARDGSISYDMSDEALLGVK